MLHTFSSPPPARQQRDRVVFAGAVLVGTAIVLVVMAFHVATWIAVAAVVAVVLLYGFMLWCWPQWHVNEYQSGEAANHLGFILALVVLAYALWEFGTERSNVPAVARGFAVAVAAVASGVAVRVFFQQFRVDLDDIDTGVRIALGDAAHEVHTQLLSLLQDLTALRATIADEIARPGGNLFTSIARRTQVALEEMLIEHVATLKTLTEREYTRLSDPNHRDNDPIASRLDVLAKHAKDINTFMRDQEMRE
jgi:hypothetical protein